MPHVVLKGSNDLQPIFNNLNKVSIQIEENIQKIKDIYFNQLKTTIIIEAFIKENEKTVSFFIMINKRNDGLVVRLHPIADIKKTNMVKSLLANIAEMIVEINDTYTIGETNLSEYLEMIKVVQKP